MKTKICLTGFFLAVMLVMVSQAAAHNMWINPGNFFPEVGETVDIGIAWGHTYKADRVDQKIKPGMFGYIRVVDPDGLNVDTQRVSETLYRLKIEKEGVYLVTAGIKPGVFTMTPKGRQWCDKKGVENPISCTNFHIDAKAVITAGKKDRNLTAATGQELEVIPLSNPATTKAGDNVELMVLFRGKPAPGISVNATYAGYSEGKKSGDIAPHGHKKGKKHHYPVSTVTDDKGKASIAPDRPGYWMVVISHKSPYPDQEICDQYMHNMAFTFEVK